jgi:hypothetical protein
MHVQVANVRGPVLMAPLGLEGHRFFRAATPHGHLQVIQLPIEGQNAATGTGRKVDALLQQRRMDPVGSQFRVLLEPLHGMHGSEIRLEGALVPGVRFVLQACELLCCPPLEGGVNGLPRGPQVLSNREGHPAFSV